MNAADWAALKDWFGRAVDARPEDVPQILADAERESPELAAELRSLLREHGSQDLHTAAVMAQAPGPIEVHPPDGPTGGQFGPYRILRELGRGGTGIVFLAERADDEFHRPVALKLLRFVAWDRRSHEFLTEERRVLSRLQHPNIATLLDWGEAPDGAPWLATEFVDGEPIDQYCRARALDVDATLALVEQVCQAVLYAHHRLVVHRDLKPANILVTAGGVVKLLDFGISRPIQEPSTTVTQHRRYTPAYASPEQIRGDPISTSTDVYSLGLVVYELLAGTLPYTARTMEDLLRRLQDVEFAPPSSAPGLGRARQRAMRGDLDRVVLHALHHDPDARYPSVGQLLDDIHAFRTGYPVRARRPGPINRGLKFVRRHRLPVALAAVAVVAMVTGTGVAVWNARIARQEERVAARRFQELQALAHSVIFDLHDSIRRLPGSVEARRLLITTAVKYLDGLNAERIDDDGLQQELAAGYVRMAYVQGGAAGVNLGQTAGALKSYRAALAILDQLWRRHPDDEQIGALRFGAAYNLSMIINDPTDGIALASGYAAEAEAWARRNHHAAPLQAIELLYSARGRLQRYAGRLDEALRDFDRAAEAQRAMMPKTAHDTAPRPMFGVSVDYGQGLFDSGHTAFARAQALLEMGRAADALASVDLAHARFREAVATGRSGPSDRRMFVRLYGLRAAVLFDLARTDDARAESRIAIEAARANTDDGSATAQRDLAEIQRGTGLIFLAKGDLVAGLAHLKDATVTIGKLVEADPLFLLNRALQACMLNDYGRALLGAKQLAQADAMFHLAFATVRHGVSEAPGWAELVRERARASAGLGLTDLQASEVPRPSALATLRQSAADWAEFRRRAPLNRRGLDEQGEVDAILRKSGLIPPR